MNHFAILLNLCFYLLLVHERMIESYAIARERFLKPGGLMFPTTGSIVLAPLTDEALYNEQLGKNKNASCSPINRSIDRKSFKKRR